MRFMFFGCSSLTSLDVSTFDTTNVTDMWAMFSACSNLTSLNISTFDTTKVTKMNFMFYECGKLMNLNLSSFDTSKVTSMRSMFQGCYALTTFTTGSSFKFVDTGYELSGTWQNTAGETFTSGNFPSNVADTYTKIAS